MPILKRLSENGDDVERNKSKEPRPPLPEIIKGRPGYASFSLAALQDHIETQLREEIGQRMDILLEARDEAARRQLVREAGEYVLAVESVPLNYDEKEALFEAVYRSFFSFGPLDAFLDDDAITELTIHGHDTVHVRRQMENPEQVVSYFEDEAQLQSLAERIVARAGGQLLDSEPFIEIGLVMSGRPARLVLVGPPLSPVLHLDLRLHPRQVTTIETLRARGCISTVDESLLSALMRSTHGALIVSEVAGGKTTLLEALLPLLPDPAVCWLVERASEVRPSQDVHRLQAIPPTADSAGRDFAAQIAAALGESPGTLILDELRGDEAAPLWKALTTPDGPRCLFVLRSSPDPRRLRNAFSILIRKGQPGVPQEQINRALLDRLPFVITTTVGAGGLRVTGIGEWAEDPDSGEVRLLSLVRNGQKAGSSPRNHLLLEDGFWTV